MFFNYNVKSDKIQSMIYKNILEGKFKERINRFVAIVEIEGREERVHVKNTGRCKELLIPDCQVYLQDFRGNMGKRSLRFSLITVKKGNRLINLDSQVTNKVVEEGLLDRTLKLKGLGKLKEIRREKVYGNSRLDFYVKDINDKKAFIEVKGVTLEQDNYTFFPDAPTERGIKHIKELEKAHEEGYESYVIFVIQMKDVIGFSPNDITHKAFGDALREASKVGIHVLAYDSFVEKDRITLGEEVEVKL